MASGSVLGDQTDSQMRVPRASANGIHAASGAHMLQRPVDTVREIIGVCVQKCLSHLLRPKYTVCLDKSERKG